MSVSIKLPEIKSPFANLGIKKPRKTKMVKMNSGADMWTNSDIDQTYTKK